VEWSGVEWSGTPGAVGGSDPPPQPLLESPPSAQQLPAREREREREKEKERQREKEKDRERARAKETQDRARPPGRRAHRWHPIAPTPLPLRPGQTVGALPICVKSATCRGAELVDQLAPIRLHPRHETPRGSPSAMPMRRCYPPLFFLAPILWVNHRGSPAARCKEGERGGAGGTAPSGIGGGGRTRTAAGRTATAAAQGGAY